MSEKECMIVRDLMPQRIEDLCSQESKELVDNHVANCPACAQQYDHMRATIPQKAQSSESANFGAALRRMRKSLIGRSVLYSLLGFAVLVLLVAAGKALYRNHYDTFAYPLPLEDYQVEVSQASDGRLLADWAFEGKPFAGERRVSFDGEALYLSFDTSKARQREDRPFRTVHIGFSLNDGRLYEVGYGYDASRPHLGREVREIRQGTPDDYQLLYQTGDSIPRLSEEKDRLLASGYGEWFFPDAQPGIPYPIKPLTTQSP